MPGIYGLVSKTEVKNNLQNMSNSMCLYEHFIQDDLLVDDCIGASRTHTGKIGMTKSPLRLEDCYIWVEGEAYNIDEIKQNLDLTATNLADLLLQAEKSNKLSLCLNQLDGFFCAAIYDQKSKKIKLMSDRNGMRLLYWYHKDGKFCWGSEVKAILAVKGIDKTLDPHSYQCFMDLGYLLDQHTWFDHIKLIKPATLMEYDINSDELTEAYYWRWTEIKPSKLKFSEAVDQLGETFLRAVEKRTTPLEGISVALSGGLDSRTIFAALDHLHPNYHGYTYTFGIPQCKDIEIAKQVYNLSKNWQHEIFHFNEENWFQPRFEKVWNTDGMQDMQHMHGIEFFEDISKNMKVNLNGYGGGLFTGEWIHRNRLNKGIDQKFAQSMFGDHCHLAPIDKEFYGLDHIEPYIYVNRNRRATNMGTVNYLISMEQRKPLMDNKVVELLLSLPDQYRIDNRLYKAMLIKFFPKYFESIPWSRTGKPVTKKLTIPTRAIRRVIREIKSSVGINTNENYTDYANWIRNKEVAQSLTNLLNPETAQYQRLTDANLQALWLQPHLEQKKVNHSHEVLRAATIEIYLRQVFKEVAV